MKLKPFERITMLQRRMLIDHMKETRYIEGKGKERKYQWAKITSELNTAGPPKTMKQWKKQWQNMRLATRKKLQEISRRHPGSPIPELNEEDNEIIFIESAQPKSDDLGDGTNDEILTQFKQEYDPSLPSTSQEFMKKEKKKYKKRIKQPLEDDLPVSGTFVQPRTKAANEIKARCYSGLCLQAQKGRKKKKYMDSDELFLLSFVGEMSKIPECRKLELKTEIIGIFKKWSKRSVETQYSLEDSRDLENDEVPQQLPDRIPIEPKQQYQPRPVSQLSQNDHRSLGTPTPPLNLNLQQHQQSQQPQQQQSHHNPLHTTHHHSAHIQQNPQINQLHPYHNHNLQHSVQQMIPSTTLQQMQHQQHIQQQQQQQHPMPSLPTQHFPIYNRFI